MTRPKVVKKEKGLARSRTTINRYTQLLRGMIYRAIDWELFKGPNPVRKVKFYRESPEVRAFSPEETKKVLAAAREVSKAAQSLAQRAIADIVLLALNTGLRRSEALGLRWRDWQNDELHVHGKGEKQRIVPLNDAARAVLARQPRRGEYIFDIPNRHEPSLFRRAFAQIQKKSGIPFTLHKCRHTFATSLLAAGTDIVTISDLLGHSKVMTSLLYSHSSPERKKRAVDSLGKKKG